ncbi:MAG: prepilin-type N-terminal cleavage/methylation domain-containing protein [Sedimentisphaerales bacterium]|nr:prepilin-type N-terminal cleavage/methylation domain-containing protein [Sedimentisphaerales bacterium]
MKILRRPYARAVTLVEVIVACVVLAIAVLGVLSYQYHATRRTILARDKLTATRTCQLLLEDWKSNGADDTYDPSSLELGFTDTGTADRYKIKVNDLPMVATLSWKDVDNDTEANVTLREIRVLLQWRLDRRDDVIDAQDPQFEMATYVRRDQSAG